MPLNDFYASCAFPKGTPQSVVKLKKAREEKATERKVRAKVNARDKHRCFWPTCKETAFHKHHKVYRSLGGKWETENIVSGCTTHHRWVHDGLIRLVGNPDKPPLEIELTRLGREAKIRVPKEA
jgi:5-methylcytosine-specific restriction endonuclease McrA